MSTHLEDLDEWMTRADREREHLGSPIWVARRTWVQEDLKMV